MVNVSFKTYCHEKNVNRYFHLPRFWNSPWTMDSKQKELQEG
jgi:hypothetical protein